MDHKYINKSRKRLKNKTDLSDKKLRKHILDFGETHPIDDLNDDNVFAKRVAYESNSDVNSQQIKPSRNEQQIETESNPYSQLLECLQSKSLTENVDRNSDDESSEYSIKSYNGSDHQFNVNSNIEKPLNRKEPISTSLPNEEMQCTSDNFSSHFYTELISSDIELLNKTTDKCSKEYQWTGVGDFVCNYIPFNKNSDKFIVYSSNIDNFRLKNIIMGNIQNTSLSRFQYEILSIITSYKNFLFTERTFENGEDIRLIYSMHALNHVLNCRSRILHHNAKLNQSVSNADDYRDQGLTRPKVLILVPFRDSVLRIIRCMIAILFGDSRYQKKFNVMNYKRFLDEFSPDGELPKLNKKPEDYEKTFSGNTDDSFRIGLAVTKKSLKLFSDFYSSDIIIASPLGLRTIIGAKGDKERDFDYLSSIEVVIMDQTDIFLMQNWEHVLHIANHLNLQPNDSHGVDFSRVRMPILEGWIKYYTQILVFSSVCNSPISALFNKCSLNYSGQVITKNIVSTSKAAVHRVYIQCRQIFHRFTCSSITSSADERFQFFISTILPKFKDTLTCRVLIYIPSYFDFVRLRNYFRKEEINFTQVCEYTKDGKVAKARSMFFNSGRRFMLFTERFHFFHRYPIKGIKHLIFYELPTYPNFYYEFCNFMHISMQGKKFVDDYSSLSCTAIYNRYDALKLFSIVGYHKAIRMLNSSTDVHMFITENCS